MKKLLRVILGWGLMMAFLVPWHARPVQASPHLAVIDITTAEQLSSIRTDLAGSYRLAADIDLSAIANWTPLGDATTPFTGTLDGGNYAIRNLVLANTQTSNQGLFGVIGAGGSVSNLRIENATVTAADAAGILAGVNYGTLSRVSAQGIIVGGTTVGGLVGDNYGAISNAFAIGTVSGRDKNGGLVGSNNAGGTLTNTYAAAQVAGAVTNHYIQFSGDEYISIPHNPAYVTDSFTLEAWFWLIPDPADTDGVDFIIGKGLENFEIHTVGTAGIRFIPVNRVDDVYNASSAAYQDVPNVLQPGWNHVAAVWDYRNQKAMVLLNGIPQHIYQNGADVGTEAPIPLKDPNTNPLAHNTNAFFVGARNDNGGHAYFPFHGKIADVRFWNTVRTPAQISADKYKQLTGTEANLIGYWKLDETSGTTVTDSSSQHNDGTIVGYPSGATPTPDFLTETSTNGGLVGANAGTITSSYYDATLYTDPDTNGTGLPTAQMKQQGSFGGWTFGASDWKISADYTYPTLFTYTVPVRITSAGPTPLVYGQPYTASFTVGEHYLGTPTGSVTVDDGDGGSCSAALTPGAPSTGACSLTSNAGSKTLTASYAGDAVFNPASGSGSYTVDKAEQAALILDAPASLTYDTTAPLSTSGGSGTGGVTYSAGASTGCAVYGTAVSVTNASGTCTLTASQAADSNYNAISSAPASVILNRLASSASITGDAPDPSVYGQPYAVAVSVSSLSGTPSGSVTVDGGADGTCSITLAGGTGSCSLTSGSLGNATLTASYAGDNNFTASSGSTAHTGQVGPTQVTLTSQTPNPSRFGETVTVGVTVAPLAPAAGTPSGTVDVLLDTTVLCSAPLADAQGACTYGDLPAGTQTLTARYNGDEHFSGSTSASVDQTVNRAEQAALTLVAPASLTYGSSAELSSEGGSGTGSVSYSAGASTGCAVSGSTLSVTDASGTCSLTASQAADSNYNAITSAPVSVILNRATSSTSITGDTPDPSVYGQPYAVSIGVTSLSGTPSGSVEVGDGSGATCSITLADGAGSCNLPSGSAGSHTVTASYAGDNNFAGSVSIGADHTVNKAEQAALTLVAPGSLTYGSTAELSSAGGSGTGSVSYSAGASSGCTVSGAAVSVTDASGTCSLTASKAADSNYNAVSSAPVSVPLDKAASSTSITGDTPDPTALGESYAVAVSVSGPGGTPSGSVTVDGGADGTCSITLADGAGSCSLTSGSLGNATLTASYAGDHNFTASSGTASHSVQSIALDDHQTSTHFTAVGHLTTSGGSAPYTYRLQTSGRTCTPTNGAGNDGFTLSGNLLERKTTTASGVYSVCVESEDATGGLIQEAFSIVINDPPALDGGSLSRLTVGTAQTAVGRLTVTGGQAPFTYRLATSGTVCTAQNSTGNAAFLFSEDMLTRRPETLAGSYPICVEVTDAEGDVAQYAYTIAVSSGPQALSLSRATVSTQQSEVGALSVQDGLAPMSYSLQTSGELCDGTNGADNAAFAVNGDRLERLEATGSGRYAVCAQAQDANGVLTQAPFTIQVVPPPAGLALSNQTVKTNQALVGTLSTTSGLFPYAYSLQTSGTICHAANGADNASFEVEGNGLKRLATATPGSYTVCLQTRDANGEVLQQQFAISVVQDAPPPAEWNVELTADQLIENDPIGTLVGTLVSNRPGTTYALVESAAFPLAEKFAINPAGELVLAKTLTPDTPATFPLRIRASAPDEAVQDVDGIVTVMKNGTTAGAAAGNDRGDLPAGDSLRLDVLANDQMSNEATAWISLQIVHYPRNGSAQIGSIIYTPRPGFHGTDTVTYRACDNRDYCVLGSVEFTVTQVSFQYYFPYFPHFPQALH